MQSTTSARKSESGFEIKIPPLPTTFAEVVRLYRQDADSPDNEGLVRLIEGDAATALFVLKRTNSAYLGLKKRVSQIDRAVTLLGFMPVCNVVLSIGLKQAFAQLESRPVQHIYRHILQVSVATAGFSRALSVHLKLRFPDTIFAAGLLHQLGRLVLLFSAPNRYSPLWFTGLPEGADPVPKPPMLAQEQAAMRHNYVSVGERVATQWRMPEEVVYAIQHHVKPEPMSNAHLNSLCYVVAAAHHAAVALVDERDDAPMSSFFGLSAPLTEFAREQEMPVRDLLQVLQDTRQEVREFADAILSG